MGTGGIRVIDLDALPEEGGTFLIPGDFWPDYFPHPKRGAFTGCNVISAYSWTVYCTECESAHAALAQRAVLE